MATVAAASAVKVETKVETKACESKPCCVFAYSNKFTDWTARNTFEAVRTHLTIRTEKVGDKEAHGTMAKVALVFASLLANLILFPVSLAMCAFRSIKDFCCSSVKEDANKATADPAKVEKKEEKADKAAVEPTGPAVITVVPTAVPANAVAPTTDAAKA